MALEFVKTEDGTGIKMNEKGFPVYVDTEDPEKENAVDAFHLLKKVPALQSDLKKKRSEVTELKAFQKTLEDLKIDVSSVDTLKEEISNLKNISELLNEKKIESDKFSDYLSKAEDAFGKIEALSSGDLKTTQEIDKIKKKLADDLTGQFSKKEKEYQEKLQGYEQKTNELSTNIFQLLVSDKFNSSKFISEKLNRSPREAKKLFGDHFKVEKTETGETKVFGYLDGEKINSLEKPGNYADFEEALQIIIENDPDKDSLLKGSGKSGTGGGGSTGTNTMMDQYKEALKKGDMATAIALKRQMKLK